MAKSQRFRVRVGERDHEVSVTPGDVPRTYRVTVDGQTTQVLEAPDGVALVRGDDGKQTAVTLDCNGRPTAATIRGRPVGLSVRSAEEAALEEALSSGRGDEGGAVAAPMPGRIVQVLVAEGDEVERGAPVVIIEAMKMENELHAPASGRVTSVSAAPGDTVESGQVLCEIEAHD